MADPGRLILDRCPNRELFERVLAVASRRLHILTRRDILRYITSEPKERAVQVQAILNISPVEHIRSVLVKVHGEFQRAANNERSTRSAARAQLATAADAPRCDRDTILSTVNRYRSLLDGTPIAQLTAGTLKENLVAPGTRGTRTGPNLDLVRSDVSRLRQALSDALLTAQKPRDQRLRETLQGLRADPLTQRAADWQRMAMQGLDLIDDDGACPLCGTEWEPGTLRERIESQLAVATSIQEKLREIAETTGYIKRYTDEVIALARTVHAAAAAIGGRGAPALQAWLELLNDLAVSLESPLDAYPDETIHASGFFEVLSAQEIPEVLQEVLDAAEAVLPQATPEQTAWDALTRIEVTLGAAVNHAARTRRAELAERRAHLLLTNFLAARDAVLGELYQSVNDRFVELYRQIHTEDENGFAASLMPDRAGLDLTVAFHGRGSHPPHALHSEGHQDSMGICLFLALSERLGANVLDLLILDDVVMSVDADHRRQVGQLLAVAFPGKQFLIMTHDRTWCNQLKSSGVVTNRTIVNFFNWSLAAGPQVSAETDQWERIEQDLAHGDVGSGAAKLRRGAEEFFGSACDALRGRVPYKLSGRWELGDFLPAAVGAYRDHLRSAKRAARSWDDNESVERIEELESTLTQIYARTSAEQWAINAAVSGVHDARARFTSR
jgi:hypothetical protein